MNMCHIPTNLFRVCKISDSNFSFIVRFAGFSSVPLLWKIVIFVLALLSFILLIVLIVVANKGDTTCPTCTCASSGTTAATRLMTTVAANNTIS